MLARAGSDVATSPTGWPGRHSADAEALLALALELTGSLDSKTVMSSLLGRSAGLASADRATLSSWRDGRITIEGTVGQRGDVTWVGRSNDHSWLADQPLVREALATRTVVIGGGLDPARAAIEFRAALAGVRHTASVPILDGGEVTGLLLLSRYRDSPFQPQALPRLGTLGVIAGMALRNVRLHQEATEAVRHLDAAQRTKSELLDIAVHELRSPLTVIQGYASLLESGDLGGLEAPAAKAVRIIAAKAREAQEIASSLLTVARLESNELRIERAAIPLQRVLESLHDRVRPRLELAAATLTMECPSDLNVLGDSALLARIMDNLVNNALIYSDPPAVITLTARAVGEQVEIRVADRGPGVADADRERIFERFFRGAGADRAAGTGLGLYVSRECARRMGGDLTLAPGGAGGGSTFLLCMPAV